MAVKKHVDVTGRRFGRWVVLKEIERQNGFRYCLCRCDCGRETPVRVASLLDGNSTACGCNNGAARMDLAGRRFDHWLVMERAPDAEQQSVAQWLCRCDCGKARIVRQSALINGTSKSCGCGSRVWTDERMAELRQLIEDGHTPEAIASGFDRSVQTISKKLRKLEKRGELSRCQAKDCRKYFVSKSPRAKYCSAACRSRSHKQKKTKERAAARLCPQCGGAMPKKTSASYCADCQEYFRKRYEANKKSPPIRNG